MHATPDRRRFLGIAAAVATAGLQQAPTIGVPAITIDSA